MEKNQYIPEENFEGVWTVIGGFGPWQKSMLVITSLMGTFFCFSAVSAAFLAATPDHVCVDVTPYPTNKSSSYEVFRNLRKDQNSIFQECVYHGLDGDELAQLEEGSNISRNFSNFNKSQGLECHSWVYDRSEFQTTIVSEWNLVCGEKYKMTVAQSSFMFGILLGGIIFSQLSDMFGRRLVSLSCCIGYIGTSVATAFSCNYMMFIILRFFVACFTMGTFLANFVIFVECSGAQSRSFLGVMFQVSFSFGLISLAILAYFIRRWQDLQLAISVPSIILLSYFWLLPRSPHWLLSQGRVEEAEEVLKSIAKGNHRNISEGQLAKYLKLPKDIPNEKEGFVKRFLKFFYNMTVLVQTPVMRRRNFIMFCQWFVVSTVYYGITFNAVNINAPIHLTMGISAAFEIISLMICSWTVNRYGRKPNVAVTFVGSGVACLIILIIPKDMIWLNMVMTTFGKMLNASAFALSFLYSSELSPTQVRNVATGAASMFGRIGAMCAPFVVDMLGEVHYAIPSTFFGILSVLAGCLTFLLPETRNKKLPETIEEIESMNR